MASESDEQSAADGNASKQASRMLEPWERRLAGGFGIALVAVSLVLFWSPPDRAQVVQGCTAESPADCVATADADPGALTTALVAAGGVMLLIAVLGQRFSSIEFAGTKVSTDAPEATEVNAKKVDKKAEHGEVEAVSQRNVAGQQLDLWSSLPTWARSALYRWAADHGDEVLTVPLTEALVEAYKPSGQGNHPWYVRLDDPSGEKRSLRISTGRGTAQVSED